jgi:hypothetical protein
MWCNPWILKELIKQAFLVGCSIIIIILLIYYSLKIFAKITYKKHKNGGK